MREPLVVLVGPTAVGKTALSLPIAQALEAEIVNVDSRQLYRYMDIICLIFSSLISKVVQRSF
jgi:tRNA dimethylallyltransferase